MSNQFVKPENALKRAEELILINAQAQALQVLQYVITAKKFRTWQPVLEKIMFKYLTLCVEQKKAKFAKDGLHKYRVTCQQANSASLENVVRHFLQLAEERAKEAQSKAEKIVLDIEDLEAEESMESLILGSVSGEDSKDRTDREVVTPWLKFLWETYRYVLEILQNNSKLEHLYQETAQQAFNFCLKFKRQTEFRRLCDMLRNHLENVRKHSNQQQAINLASPESLQLHLDTRFVQLHAASELELWQEAFRSIEDIHSLITTSKKTPPPSILAAYYQKLAQIFWVSENYLHHSFACHKYYNVSKQHNANLGEEEQKMMASSVLLSTMAIPFEESQDIFDFDAQQQERISRLSSLLSFGPAVTPKRSFLVEELTTRNISNQAIPELRDFYALMEKKFNPLQFCQLLTEKLEVIKDHPTLKQYVKPLERLMVIRLLQQLSRVYETIKISEFTKLIPFTTFGAVEKLIADAVKKQYLSVRVDFQNGILNFKTESFESDQMREQLKQLAKSLQTAINMINKPKTEDIRREKEKVYSGILQSIQEEHQRVISRKAHIEKKKEMIELQLRKKAAMEEEERRKKAEAGIQEEAARRAKVAAARSSAKAMKMAEESTRKELEAWLVATGQQVSADQVTEIMEDLAADRFMKKRMEEKEKEQRELVGKLKKFEKKLDWVERAKREEEIPLLKQLYEKQQIEDKEYYQSTISAFLKAHKEKHERDLQEKKRLSKMVSEKEKFEEGILKRRKELYEKLKKEREERLVVKKQKSKEEAERREKEEVSRRIEQELLQKEMEQEEEIRRKEEEKKREEDQHYRQEEEERLRKLQEQAEKQRKKEEEAIEKLKKDEAERLGREKRDLPVETEPWRPSAREREPAVPGPYRPPSSRREPRNEFPPSRGDFGPRRENAPPRGEFGRPSFGARGDDNMRGDRFVSDSQPGYPPRGTAREDEPKRFNDSPMSRGGSYMTPMKRQQLQQEEARQREFQAEQPGRSQAREEQKDSEQSEDQQGEHGFTPVRRNRK